MQKAVEAILEVMLERLCDLEEQDPCLYVIFKEQLALVSCAAHADPDMTLEKVKEMLDG